jgi:hypothetical protein
MISPAASAQYPGGRGGGTRGGMGSSHAAQEQSKTRDTSVADTPSDSGAPVLVQLDQLEDDLKLTPQQRAAWNDYADKVLRLADDMTRSRFAARALAPAAGTTAVQQLDQMAGSARSLLTAVEDIVEAGKAFYAILTPAQKAIADRRLVRAMPPLATGISPPVWATRDTVGGR